MVVMTIFLLIANRFRESATQFWNKWEATKASQKQLKECNSIKSLRKQENCLISHLVERARVFQDLKVSIKLA